MRRLSIVFLLFLLPCCLFAQQAAKRIDSMKRILPSMKDDTVKVRLMLRIAEDGLRVDVFDSIQAVCNRALALSEKLGFAAGKASAYTIKAQAYNRKGDYSSSIKYFTDAYRLHDSLGNRHPLMNIMNGMGNAYLGINDLDHAHEAYESALKIATEIRDTVFMGIAIFGKGNIDLEQKHYKEAIAEFEAAYAWFKQKNHKNTFAALVSLGESYRKSGEPERALSVLQQEEKRGVDNLYFRERLLFGIGNCYGDLNNFKKAISYYEQALEIDLAQSNYHDAAGVANKLSEAYEKDGDLKNALRVQKLYIAFNDSVFNNKLAEQFTEIDGKFQNEKKQKEIELLNKDKLIADAELKRSDAELFNSRLLRNFMIAIAIVFAGLLVVSYRGYRQKKRDNSIIAKEKKKSDDLLLNILPAETAEELKRKGHADARGYDMVTVLFTDFVGFTSISEKKSPQELVADLNECFTWFDEIISKYRIEKIKTIGDAYMAAGGLPKPDANHAVRVVNAAIEMRDFITQRKMQNPETGFDIRIGIHTGPVVAGIVGVRKFAYDIWGDTVNTAARMESSGENGKVNVSQATYELVQDKFRFSFRGKIAAKGKGEIAMYFAEPLTENPFAKFM